MARESRKSLVPAAVGDWASAFAVMRIGMGQTQLSGCVGGHTADNVADGSRSTAVRGRLGGRSSRELRSLGRRTRQGREETGGGVGWLSG